MKPVFLSLLIFLSVSFWGQTVSSVDDRSRILKLNEVAGKIGKNHPDSAVVLLKKALEESERLNFKEGMGACLLTLGELSNQISDYNAALSYYLRAHKLYEQLERDKVKESEKNISAALCGIGITYDNKGNFPEAVKYYISSLKISEKLNDKGQQGTTLLNIGIVYFRQNEFEKALSNFQQALKLAEQTPKLSDDAIALGNIGSAYDLINENEKSLEYLFRALKMTMSENDKTGISTNLSNIGNIYLEKKEYDKALNYYFRGLTIDRELGSKTELAIKIGNIGWTYCDMKNYKEAEKYLLEAIVLERETGSIYYEANYHYKLSELYEETKRFGLALEQAKEARALTDSLFNSEKHDELASREANYLFEKKENEEKIKHENEMQQAESDRKRQNIIIWAACFGLALVTLFSFFLYKRFRIVKNQKQMIEAQKEFVEEKQKEIMDSIRYAKRIQLSLLPNEKVVQRNFHRLKNS